MLRRSADDRFSIAVESAAEAQALATHLLDQMDAVDIVPGMRSVVARFDLARHMPAVFEEELRGLIATLPVASDSPQTRLEIPVAYGGDDGPDLARVCASAGITEQEFIDLHTGRDFPVELLGFTPGFAFVSGLDERFDMPRRKTPRASVPAGSVGIAAGRTGLYAISSPGGWSIVGRTPQRLFDPDAENPFAIDAGMLIRFRAL